MASSDWHEIGVPRALASTEYDNYWEYVFNIPAGCEYEGYTFAHPRKISEYAGPCTMLLLREDWVFDLWKEAEPGVLDESAETVELPLRDWLRIMCDAGCLFVTDSEGPFWLDLMDGPDEPTD